MLGDQSSVRVLIVIDNDHYQACQQGPAWLELLFLACLLPAGFPTKFRPPEADSLPRPRPSTSSTADPTSPTGFDRKPLGFMWLR